MANAVAPGSKNVLRSYRLRVAAMRFKALAPFYDSKDKKPPVAESLLEGLSFEILKDGYVILVQTGTATESLTPSDKYATAARTNANGELVWLEEGELDGGVPTDPARVMLFELGAQFAMFWTAKKDLFKAIWQLVNSDPAKTIAEHPFSRFEVTPHAKPARPKSLQVTAGNNFKLDMLLYAASGAYDGGPAHGVVPGFAMQGRMRGTEVGATYVFARSDAMAALYVSELFGRIAYEKQIKNAEHWMIFEGVRDIARHAFERLRSPDLDSGLRTFTAFGKQYPAGAWNEHYFDYAYSCAESSVPHGLFWDAINWAVNDTGWQRAAVEIWERYKIPHPAYLTGHLRHGEAPQKFAVNNYFNFYEYGFRNNPAPWDLHARTARQAIINQIDILRARRRDFMSVRADYGRFLQEIDAHLPDDLQVCMDISESYIDAALETGYLWWKDFQIESDPYWARLKIYADQTGTVFDKMGEILAKILDNRKKALAINALLNESVPAIEKFFEKMVAFDDRFKNKTKVKREIRDGLEIEVNFNRGVLTIKNTGEAAREIGPIRFLVEQVGTIPKETNVLQPPRKSGAMKKRYKKMVRQLPIHSVRIEKVPFVKIRQWPTWLSAMGDAISLAVSIVDVRDKLRKGEKVTWDMWGQVAMNSFQQLGSISQVIELAKYAKGDLPWFLKFGKGVGLVGQVMEAGFNVRTGSLLLFTDDESTVTRALERGDAVEANLQRVKGWVLFVSPAPAVLASGAGAWGAIFGEAGGWAAGIGTGTVVSSLGIGLAVAGLIVVTVDIIVYEHSGPSNVMDPFAGKVNKALEVEFGDAEHPGPSQTQHNVTEFVDAAKEMLRAMEA